MQSPDDELYRQNGSDRRQSSGSPLHSEQGSQRGGYISRCCGIKEWHENPPSYIHLNLERTW